MQKNMFLLINGIVEQYGWLETAVEIVCALKKNSCCSVISKAPASMAKRSNTMHCRVTCVQCFTIMT